MFTEGIISPIFATSDIRELSKSFIIDTEEQTCLIKAKDFTDFLGFFVTQRLAANEEIIGMYGSNFKIKTQEFCQRIQSLGFIVMNTSCFE